VGLPPGEARLRRRIVLALTRRRPQRFFRGHDC
jgi:hypothetical protein